MTKFKFLLFIALLVGFLAGAFPVITCSASACFESSILSPSPFMGNDGEIFKLADGSLWEVKYEYEYLYEYYPDVIICPYGEERFITLEILHGRQVVLVWKQRGDARRITSMRYANGREIARFQSGMD